MKRTIATIIAASCLLPIAGVFTASQLRAQTETLPVATLLAQNDEQPEPNRREGRGDRLERLAEELDLTEEQISQMQAIREGERDEMQALHANLRTEREALHALMAGDTAESDLRTQYESVQALHRDLADKRFETMLATREILTVEQRTELAAIMEQRRAERRENRGFGRMRGGERPE